MNIASRKIKLCVVSPLYHPSLGGLGRQAKLLTERLAEDNDIELFVIARRMKGMPPAEFSPRVRVIRAWSFYPRMHIIEDRISIKNLLTSLSFCISCGWFLWKNRKQYDIVHFHGAGLPLIINLPLLKLLRKKVIAKVAASNLGTEAGSLKGRYFGIGSLLAECMKKVDVFVAISEEIKRGLIRDGIEETKIKQIPNFVDIENYRRPSPFEKTELKKKLGLKDDVVVLFSGRFVPRKGVNYLLEAWVRVQREIPSVKLVLLGDGPTFKEMQSYAERLGIKGSVLFKGHVSNVKEFLQSADLFVLPSLQEGMPNALLEAMACALPTVATRIGGVEDIIEDGYNGILVKPADPESLASGLKKLIENKSLRKSIADNAYKTIIEKYSLESVVPRYIRLYKELLQKE